MMRISTAALALIQRTGPTGQTETLAQWSESWQRFALVGGHVEPGETFRECCLREVAEELCLMPEVDFHVADTPVRPLLEYEAFSHGSGVMTRYRVELYRVDILTNEAAMKIAANPENRWLQSAEIDRMITSEGQPISEQLRRVLSGNLGFVS